MCTITIYIDIDIYIQRGDIDLDIHGCVALSTSDTCLTL